MIWLIVSVFLVSCKSQGCGSTCSPTPTQRAPIPPCLAQFRELTAEMSGFLLFATLGNDVVVELVKDP